MTYETLKLQEYNKQSNIKKNHDFQTLFNCRQIFVFLNFCWFKLLNFILI